MAKKQQTKELGYTYSLLKTTKLKLQPRILGCKLSTSCIVIFFFIYCSYMCVNIIPNNIWQRWQTNTGISASASEDVRLNQSNLIPVASRKQHVWADIQLYNIRLQ